MAKKRFTPFLPTQTLNYGNSKKACNEWHIRISKSMFYSEAYLSLNGNAMKLYQALRFKFYKEEEENREFALSKSLGVRLLHLPSSSEQSIRRSLKELVKKGFLERTYISKGGGKTNKIPNRYKFSQNWKTYS